MAVPLAVFHPPAELAYSVEDSGASVVVASPEMADRLRPIAEERGLRFLLTTDLWPAARGGNLARAHAGSPRDDRLYQRHHLPAQGCCEHPRERSGPGHHPGGGPGVAAGGSILLVLPLHHVVGIINVLTCALLVRHPGDDPAEVRCRCSLGGDRLQGADPLHGGAHHLQPA